MQLAHELYRDTDLIEAQLEVVLDADRVLITRDDTSFRFHSGPLAVGATAL